jgi:transposase
LSLPNYTRQRRDELLRLYVQLQQRIRELDGQVEKQVQQRPQALRLLTHPGVGPVTALALRKMPSQTYSDYDLYQFNCGWK